MNVQELGLVNVLSKCLFILKSCLDDKYMSLWSDTGSRKRWEFRRCTGNILLIAVIKRWLTGLCLVMSKWALDNHEINFLLKWRAMKWATRWGLSAKQSRWVGNHSDVCYPYLPFGCFWEEHSPKFVADGLGLSTCRDCRPTPRTKKRHLSPNEHTSYHLWVPRKCRTRCLS